MPQARRKTPFSGKAKKQQLQSKKQNKTLLMPTTSGNTSYDVVSVNYQGSKRGQSNRYALKFYRESDEELRLKKEEALKALKPVPPAEMEVDPKDFFPSELSFPQRPQWDFNMTPAQLDAQEQKYFREYVQTLQKSEHWKDISYFELNLETWRQLWRVLEMCDILLLIVDVRYAGMMFPPSLYEYIKKVNKDMVLVLNKIDLVPPTVVASWKKYLTEKYPGLEVVYFTSCPGYNLVGASTDKAGLQVRRRKGRQRLCVEGSTKLLEACKELVKGEVDLSAWEKKIREESEKDLEFQDVEVGETIIEKPDTSYYSHVKYKNGVLTVGCVGTPNVGKSSLMNSIMGKKVVSVSRTPGHTKHFQTIYLTNQVRLCDCPGLVFPSLVPRAIQVLMGSYPIAQLREPYTTIRYLGERLDLPSLLRIQHPDNDDTWSPRDICDGWAKQRGYLTAKAASIFTRLCSREIISEFDQFRTHSGFLLMISKHGGLTAIYFDVNTAGLDTYRAANSLLRMALDGKLCLWVRPRLSPEDFDKIKTCEELNYIKWVQASSQSESQSTAASETDSDSEATDDSGDTDEDEHSAIANKFAALSNE